MKIDRDRTRPKRQLVCPFGIIELFELDHPSPAPYGAEYVEHGLVLALGGATQTQQRRMDGRSAPRTPSMAGELNFFPAGTSVSGLVKGRLQYVSVRFQPEIVEQLMGSRNHPAFRAPVIARFDPLSISLAYELRSEMAAPKVNGPFLEAALSLLLFQFTRISGAATDCPIESPKLSAVHLKKVLDCIEADLHGPVTLSHLASTIGVSVAYFCRLFRNSTGRSPYQFITERRVERARTLLVCGHLSLAEIAHEVGFNSQSHLTTHFKRVLGMSPGRYRLTKRNQ